MVIAVDMPPPPPSLEQAESSYVSSATRKELPNVALTARLEAVRDSGKSLGIQTGINRQMYFMKMALQKHEREMDTVYDFGRLMIQGRVVPPIITELRDQYHQEGDTVIKLSGVQYNIEQQARFSSVPPTWKQYFEYGTGNTNYTNITLGLQISGDEEHLFRQSIRDGYQEGIEAANTMFKQSFERLNRDYTGMLRFDTYVKRGMISMPIIATADIEMTNTGSRLVLDEQLLRITVMPSFNSDINNWKTWVKPAAQVQKMKDLRIIVDSDARRLLQKE